MSQITHDTITNSQIDYARLLLVIYKRGFLMKEKLTPLTNQFNRVKEVPIPH